MNRSPVRTVGVGTIIVGVALMAVVTSAYGADASQPGVAQSRGIARPRQGQSVELVQKQTKKQQTANGPMTMVIEVPITLSVVRADDQGSTFRWKRGSMKLTDLETDATKTNPALKEVLIKAALAQSGAILGAMDNLTFDLNLSPKGEYLGLANYDEVRAAGVRSFDEMDKLRRQHGNPPLDPRLRESLLSRQTLEQVFPKEPLLYLAWTTHATLRRGQSGTFETALPNPLGGGAGKPVPGRISVSVDEAADDRGRTVVRTSNSLDMEKLAESMKQAIAATPGGKPLTAEDVAAFRQAQYKVTCEYHVDPATGLPTLAMHETSINVAGAENSEQFVWTAR